MTTARGASRSRARAVKGLGAALTPLLAAAACELEEVTLVDAEDVVVAEVYLNVAENPAENEILAFLHRTIGTSGTIDELRAATVEVVRTGDGGRYRLTGVVEGRCVETAPSPEPGACFLLADSTTADLAAGDVFEVEVRLPDGSTIRGATRLPGAFAVESISGSCRLSPDRLMDIEWSRSGGAWAYLNETSIFDLPDALAPEGIEVEEDPLYLLGLSISDADTVITFPSEFGVFDRFDLEQDLALRLQTGLPAGTRAEVAITAVDRNFVNWSRGGNFNPSGQVRVPSMDGDGTGVFAASIRRSFDVFVGDSSDGSAPDCPGVRPPGPPPG